MQMGTIKEELIRFWGWKVKGYSETTYGPYYALWDAFSYSSQECIDTF